MVKYATGHPLDDKQALAEWMKYPDVAMMDREHDDLHRYVCDFFAVKSWSMAKRDGERLTAAQEDLAACEEAAVLHLQRWLQWLAVNSE